MDRIGQKPYGLYIYIYIYIYTYITAISPSLNMSAIQVGEVNLHIIA